MGNGGGLAEGEGVDGGYIASSTLQGAPDSDRTQPASERITCESDRRHLSRGPMSAAIEQS